MQKLKLIKIGGNVIDDPGLIKQFLIDFSEITGPKILVHGGGKMATALASRLGIQQQLIDGRRVTDDETLKIAVMVYAGLVNKSIVAGLQALQCKTVGLTGADGDLIKSKKRTNTAIDFGFVGDILPEGVDAAQLEQYINNGYVPVIAPITHDGNGILLNTNADTMAAEIAVALSKTYAVDLVYCFEKSGVLNDPNDPASCLTHLNHDNFLWMKNSQRISSGMIPKLENAFKALEAGCNNVVVCHAAHVNGLELKHSGTQLV